MGIFGKTKSESESQPIEVAGRPLRCVVCTNATFWHRRALMHGRGVTFFGFEWASPAADCAVCANCGYVHWFLPRA